LCGRFGPERIVFSLDLLAGQAMGSLTGWRSREPLEIAREAMAAGVRRMIVLDLARVGVRGGLGTLDLCRVLSAADPRLELITGGGIRGTDDLRELRDAGVDAALVASALHDGSLTRDALS
jgi:phosphoribosylformimino-5-aminoimidazole carboxamide ribotide isomerase